MWCAIRRREATASMVPSNIGYSLHEAFRHFRRNWSTVLGAIVTIFLSLFVIGMFVLGSVLVGNLVGNVEDRVTIQAFLSDNADKTAVEALQKKVDGWKNVESVSYKSKEEALKQYKETMSNRNAADAVAALDGENPVPASLVIKLSDPQDVEKVANKLIKDADFAKVADNASNPSDSVQYGRETARSCLWRSSRSSRSCSSTTPSASPSRRVAARSRLCAWSARLTASSAGRS